MIKRLHISQAVERDKGKKGKISKKRKKSKKKASKKSKKKKEKDLTPDRTTEVIIYKLPSLPVTWHSMLVAKFLTMNTIEQNSLTMYACFSHCSKKWF